MVIFGCHQESFSSLWLAVMERGKAVLGMLWVSECVSLGRCFRTACFPMRSRFLVEEMRHVRTDSLRPRLLEQFFGS